jgi:hypothetical protein
MHSRDVRIANLVEKYLQNKKEKEISKNEEQKGKWRGVLPPPIFCFSSTMEI